jgi:(R,R)-butanediol dehydrogenase/meso-butanediol dehydrogenase/diacetyl reductase
VRYDDWQSRELTVVGTLAYNHEDFLYAVRLVAERRLDLDVLHTATIGLAWLRDTLEELDSGNSRHTKILVSPLGRPVIDEQRR